MWGERVSNEEHVEFVAGLPRPKINLDDVKMPSPTSVRKVKDKFGFHRVYVYDGLEGLTYLLAKRIKEQKRKQDSVYMVAGLEGTGKSMFTLWALDIYSELSDKKINIGHVTRRLDELFTRIYKLKDTPSCLTLDEGSELSGENTMTKKVRSTKNKFTVMRKCSHIIFICFINPLRITTYFREDRVRGLFFVVRPGEVWFYSNNQNNPHLANIIDSWSKEHDAKSLKFLKRYAPDMILRGIPDYNGWLRYDYENRKDENILGVLKEGISSDEFDDVDDGGLKKVWYNVDDSAKYTGLKTGTMRNYHRSGVITGVKIRNRIHFSLEELDKLLSRGARDV